MSNVATLVRGLVNRAEEFVDDADLVLGQVADVVGSAVVVTQQILSNIDTYLAAYEPTADPDDPAPETVVDSEVSTTPDFGKETWDYIKNQLVMAADKRYGADKHWWRDASYTTQAGKDGLWQNFTNLVQGKDGWTDA